jgi:hypothetical protein
MKKLITLLLILSLALPAGALAITGDSPYFGRWIAQKHGSTGNCSAILYYLFINENSPCAYFEFDLQHGGILTRASLSDSNAYASNWEIVDDHLRIPTSPIEYIDVYYDKDTDTLYTTEWPALTFVRIP